MTGPAPRPAQPGRRARDPDRSRPRDPGRRRATLLGLSGRSSPTAPAFRHPPERRPRRRARATQALRSCASMQAARRRADDRPRRRSAAAVRPPPHRTERAVPWLRQVRWLRATRRRRRACVPVDGAGLRPAPPKPRRSPPHPGSLQGARSWLRSGRRGGRARTGRTRATVLLRVVAGLPGLDGARVHVVGNAVAVGVVLRAAVGILDAVAVLG